MSIETERVRVGDKIRINRSIVGKIVLLTQDFLILDRGDKDVSFHRDDIACVLKLES